jgi:type IV fimbrial biogenesis protein FimT
MSLRPSKGFTLVELMTTVAVVAILSTIAYPSFQGILRSNRMAATSNQLIGALSLARSEAVMNTRGAGVCASTVGTSCDGSAWTQGWMVWSDPNRSGTFDSGDTVLRFTEGRTDLRATSNQPLSIGFDGRGRNRANAAQDITLRPDQCGSQPLQRRLTVSPTGQLRMTKETCA